MDDLISRTWLLAEYDKRHKGPPGGARKLIEEAPSALGTNLADVGTDCISRQQAIDALWAERMKHAEEMERNLETCSFALRADNKARRNRVEEDIEIIRQLPSAQKMGKWIYHIDDLFPAESTMECNQCHAEQPLTCDDEFCPHCGAKMEVTE